MPEIFGVSRTALRERVGSLSQVARVDSLIEAEGAARGARRLRLVNGGGIEVDIHPDRALDLGQITVGGIPIAWMAPGGISAPQFYDGAGYNWLRTFGGGALVTCGLDTFGPPSIDAGQSLGQHGRIGAQPAQILRQEATEDAVIVEGVVRQSSALGENLLLHRTIASNIGSDTVTVNDTVTNEGFQESPHMILYHCNFGWPLLDADSILDIPTVGVTARDADAEPGLAQWAQIGPPVPGWREQVYRHEVQTPSPATVTITNPRLGVQASLTFNSEALPFVYQWKMVGQGTYVLGIEPSNCGNVFGRAAARAAGELPILAAGESAQYSLEFRLNRFAPAEPEDARENDD